MVLFYDADDRLDDPLPFANMRTSLVTLPRLSACATKGSDVGSDCPTKLTQIPTCPSPPEHPTLCVPMLRSPVALLAQDQARALRSTPRSASASM
mmetsp:Transcript_18493/g.55221  ORF Transcript_18493/g.55221 Transcript_18493/m.55221 type:complete len:95 (+) Transcript_18493:117-401(+)